MTTGDALSRGGRGLLDPYLSFSGSLELLPVAAYLCNADGYLVAFNAAAAALWGRTPKCVATDAHAEASVGHEPAATPPDRWCGSSRLFDVAGQPIAHDECWMARAIREGKPFLRQEILIERPDGTRVAAVAHANPIRGSDGEIIGAVNILTDITERHRAEQSMRDAHARTEALAQELAEATRRGDQALRTSRAIFEQEPHCVKIVDADGRLIDMNPAGIAAIEADSLSAAVGALTIDLIVPEYRELYRAALADAIRLGQSHAEFEIIGLRGTRRRMEQRAVRLLDHTTADGQPLVLAVTRDITAQRAAEAENRLLAEVVRRSRSGAIVADAEGRTVWINEGFTRVTGYTLDELRGRKPGEILRGPDTDAAESRRIGHAVRQGVPCSAELINYSKLGRRYTVRIELEPLLDARGVITGYMAIETDVTDQRRMEAELSESEARFRSLVNNIPGVVFRVRPDGANEFVSDGIERLTGYPAREFVGPEAREYGSVTHPDDVGLVDDAFARAVASRSSYGVEYRIVHRDGSVHWIFEHGQVLFDERTGDPTWIDGVQFDITDRKHAEERLRATTAELEEAQIVGKLGNWSYDLTSERVTWSTQLYRIFDRDPDLGHPALAEAIALYDPNDVPLLTEQITRSMETGDAFSIILRTASPSPAARYVRAEGRARRDASGRIVGLFGTAMDVTAEVEREAALREAQRRAEAASQSKSEFLANMSHEIRTPMTAILGYADLLAEHGARDQAPPDRLEYIETIRRNGEHLLAIINDILDVSKIEAGKMTVESVPTRPDALVDNVLSLMAVKAQAKGIVLESRFSTPVPETIDTDPVRLRQILVNLLGNAIKFTAVGSVLLEVRFDAEGGGRLRFDVVDTGIGLEPQQLPGLFDAFVQADSSTTRRFGGTGLGLRISKRLAEMLGGDITVTSVAGRGSTFSLSIAAGPLTGVAMIDVTHASAALDAGTRTLATSTGPGPALVAPTTAAGASTEPAAHSPLPLAGIRILLAEDGLDNQRLIAFHLKKAGAEMHMVENGRLAVESLTADGSLEGQLRQPPPFDLIVTDMQMPVMDGYAAMQLLRAKGCTLPIIALTAHAMSGDRERCRAAGCDEYATKPINKQTLIQTCVQVLRGRGEFRRAA